MSSRLKVLKCLFQYPIDRLFPPIDRPRAVFDKPIVPLSIAPWMWRAVHVDAVQNKALPSPQVLQEPVVKR